MKLARRGGPSCQLASLLRVVVVGVFRATSQHRTSALPEKIACGASARHFLITRFCSHLMEFRHENTDDHADDVEADSTVPSNPTPMVSTGGLIRPDDRNFFQSTFSTFFLGDKTPAART